MMAVTTDSAAARCRQCREVAGSPSESRGSAHAQSCPEQGARRFAPGGIRSAGRPAPIHGGVADPSPGGGSMSGEGLTQFLKPRAGCIPCPCQGGDVRGRAVGPHGAVPRLGVILVQAVVGAGRGPDQPGEEYIERRPQVGRGVLAYGLPSLARPEVGLERPQGAAELVPGAPGRKSLGDGWQPGPAVLDRSVIDVGVRGLDERVLAFEDGDVLQVGPLDDEGRDVRSHDQGSLCGRCTRRSRGRGWTTSAAPDRLPVRFDRRSLASQHATERLRAS